MDVNKNHQDAILMVTIRCITYNHEPYIRQCLEGFVIQKTNFRFEAIVHDDASTDKTADIIREYAAKYPEIIKPIYETENQYSKHDGSLRRIMDAVCTGKYVAMCEGDDYWTDPLKLQKQVDFLENHEEYGMVHTYARRFLQKEQTFSKYLLGEPYNTFNDLVIKNRVVTVTVFLRKELLFNYIQDIHPESKKWKMGDYPMWLWFSYNSKIGFLNDVTSVYRNLEESASSTKNISRLVSFEQSVLEIKLFFSNLYNASNQIKNRIYDQYYRTLLNIGYHNKQRKMCIENFFLLKKKNIKDFVKFFLILFHAKS